MYFTHRLKFYQDANPAPNIFKFIDSLVSRCATPSYKLFIVCPLPGCDHATPADVYSFTVCSIPGLRPRYSRRCTCILVHSLLHYWVATTLLPPMYTRSQFAPLLGCDHATHADVYSFTVCSITGLRPRYSSRCILVHSLLHYWVATTLLTPMYTRSQFAPLLGCDHATPADVYSFTVCSITGLRPRYSRRCILVHSLLHSRVATTLLTPMYTRSQFAPLLGCDHATPADVYSFTVCSITGLRPRYSRRCILVHSLLHYRVATTLLPPMYTRSQFAPLLGCDHATPADVYSFTVCSITGLRPRYSRRCILVHSLLHYRVATTLLPPMYTRSQFAPFPGCDHATPADVYSFTVCSITGLRPRYSRRCILVHSLLHSRVATTLLPPMYTRSQFAPLPGCDHATPADVYSFTVCSIPGLRPRYSRRCILVHSLLHYRVATTLLPPMYTRSQFASLPGFDHATPADVYSFTVCSIPGLRPRYSSRCILVHSLLHSRVATTLLPPMYTLHSLLHYRVATTLLQPMYTLHSLLHYRVATTLLPPMYTLHSLLHYRVATTLLPPMYNV